MKNYTYAIADTDLSVRTRKALERGGVLFLNEIESIEQLRRIRNIGPSGISEIISCLERNGLPALPEILPSDITIKKARKRAAIDIAIDVLKKELVEQRDNKYILFAIEELNGLLKSL